MIDVGPGAARAAAWMFSGSTYVSGFGEGRPFWGLEAGGWRLGMTYGFFWISQGEAGCWRSTVHVEARVVEACVVFDDVVVALSFLLH
jgi:hypothetical protein